jgi:hypothetical protein
MKNEKVIRSAKGNNDRQHIHNMATAAIELQQLEKHI